MLEDISAGETGVEFAAEVLVAGFFAQAFGLPGQNDRRVGFSEENCADDAGYSGDNGEKPENLISTT